MNIPPKMLPPLPAALLSPNDYRSVKQAIVAHYEWLSQLELQSTAFRIEQLFTSEPELLSFSIDMEAYGDFEGGVSYSPRTRVTCRGDEEEDYEIEDRLNEVLTGFPDDQLHLIAEKTFERTLQTQDQLTSIMKVILKQSDFNEWHALWQKQAISHVTNPGKKVQKSPSL